ncbi:MAG: sugar phosphate isomerase/epimerase, partial [Chloroflexota bacterium]|nr:sugar phosphate isomerase/epimerase [Chloroflexota bacterium]
LDANNVGVLLDSWHLFAAGENLAAMDALTSQDVVVVHVNDAPPNVPWSEQIDTERRLPLETGVIDLPGFMAKLREIGYAGPVAPEPFDAALSELGARDLHAAATRTAASMFELWRNVV